MYNIIYEAERDIKQALAGLLTPIVTENFVGFAEVRNLFRIPRIGTIAGSYVKEGYFTRGHKIRLVREGRVIYTGNLGSLKRFKDDVKEVKEGFECGIGIENYNDVKVGDVIEAFELVEKARTL
jgi:translation initiation factor IF-2